MPRVIQSVEPYISSKGIEKGARWASDLAAQLEGTNFGIVCLLPENTTAAWIQFEAGALSKSLDNGKVAPILFGVEEGELADNPLMQFQFTNFVKDDMLKLMESINRADGIEILKQSLLESAFEKNWTDLQENVEAVVAATQAPVRYDTSLAKHEKAFEDLTALAREQTKRLIALEEKIGRLNSSDVVKEDRLVTLKFFDGLLEFAIAARKSVAEIEAEISARRTEAEAYTMSGSVRRLDNIKGGLERLTSAARKAKEGGGSTKAVGGALVDMRRALSVMESW
jgi:hypothetical protein